jgi:hypothetical protein
MEIAKPVLEFLKVLIWPIIALYAIIRFREALGQMLVKLSARLQTAETLKFGVMGSGDRDFWNRPIY